LRQIHDVKDPPRERDAPAILTRFDSPPSPKLGSPGESELNLGLPPLTCVGIARRPSSSIGKP